MSKQTTIRVMLVDDHDMVRRGLAVFLHAFSDLELVAEASNGPEAIALCAEHQPDVILMDLIMPEMSGVEVTRIIRQRYPDVQIIALTSFKDESLIRPVLEAGAISYLFKNVSIDDLADAIRAAYAGRSTLVPEATRALLAATRTPPKPDYGLTDREKEVLYWLVAGLNNVEIAEKLSVSRHTIKTHVSNVLGKLNVANRVEAVKLALDQNLLDD